VTVLQSLYKDRVSFWLKDIPKLLKKDKTSTTTSYSTEHTTEGHSNKITGSSMSALSTKPTTPKPKGNGSQTLASQSWYFLLVILAAISRLL
jgi:hypothetical protein